MSRVGKQPIAVPSGVSVNIEGRRVTVTGPKGELSREFHPDIAVRLDDGQLLVSRPTDRPEHRSLHGLTRSLLANMVTGVSTGFTKMLELHGVGYRAQMQGQNLVLQVGYSRPVEVKPPAGIILAVEGTSRVMVQGMSRELVGQVAADIRAVRPPDPYKGKGIRYEGERVRHKAGKAGKAIKH
ncbi:MAG: 50S ribosomal protein L6 [Dehalococcoidia bacterium SM23_28_2]|nr:MAG: 50S ribosomal protein L6 [Dehalococcoidia bacterium SM23_28_2]